MGPGTGFYDVVVLVEREIDQVDAAQLRALHEGVDEQVCYHVLLPVQDPARGVEGAMGALSTGEVFVAPPVTVPGRGDDELRDELLEECRARVHSSIAALEATGARATGSPVCQEPVHALIDLVGELDAREVIIMTRPHVVREFFHLDWTSRAERRLRVPVLHLLEHEHPDLGDGPGPVAARP